MEKLDIHSNCQWCGKDFIRKSQYNKFCSRECLYEASKKLKREQWAVNHIPKTYICKECGTAFTAECGNTHSVFCCRDCADKHERRTEHATKRHKEYMRGIKRQRVRQIAASFVEDVSYEEIYSRDNGICQICGLPVIKDKFKDPNWSGSIDHVIPVSKGGKHSLANCQLAHRICNSLKAKETGEYSIDWSQKSQESNYWLLKFRKFKELLAG